MAPKVRVRRDRKFLNLSTFTSIFMILISTILIAISSLDLAGVFSFRYFDPNWLANLDLNQLLDQLPADWNNMENTVIFDYETDYEGTLLFRTQNYGDYSKNWLTGKWNWADAPRYDTTGDEVVPQNIFAAKIQSQSKLRPHSITVTPRQNLGANAVVPLVSYIPPMLENGFYTEEGLPPDGDKGFRGDKPSYEFTFYGYDDISSSIIEAPIRDSSIKKAAETYSSFAKQRYLTIDDESKNQLREYAMARGIREDSPTLVEDLIRFVKNDNYYPISVGDDGRPVLGDFSMEGCPSNMSPMVYFATEYHQGIWMHFAGAATLYLRAFGIPARYTTGYREYYGEPENSIGLLEMWAWTEAWNDNAGWVPYDPGISLNTRVTPSMMTGGISGLIGKGQGPEAVDTPVAMFQVAPAGGDFTFNWEDPIYFRYASYGDYSGSNWGEAPTPDKTSSPLTPAYFWIGTTARVMLDGGNGGSISVQSTDSLNYSLAPSYSVMTDGGGGFTDDHIELPEEATPISYQSVELDAYSYSYPYFIRNVNTLQLKLRGFTYFETPKYHDWVYENFLDFEDPSNPEVGSLVKTFAQNSHLSFPKQSDYSNMDSYYSAVDNFWNDVNSLVNSLAESVYFSTDLPTDIDPIVYLLTRDGTRKTANHTMLASVEVMLLRALGVPARYVTGFLGQTGGDFYGQSNPFMGVLTAANAYAWCEAYEEGVGWRRLDPTSPIQVGQVALQPGEMDEYSRYEYRPQVKNVTAFYDGTVPDYLPEPVTSYGQYSNLQQGDTVQFLPVTDFVKKDVGTYIGLYRAKVTDRGGRDVTNCYRFPAQYGTVTILPRPIVLTTPSLEGYMSEGYGVSNPFQGTETFEQLLMYPTAWGDGVNGYQAWLNRQTDTPFCMGLVDGEWAQITSRAYLTSPDSTDYTVSLRFYDRYGADVTGNYAVDYYSQEEITTSEGSFLQWVRKPGTLTLHE